MRTLLADIRAGDPLAIGLTAAAGFFLLLLVAGVIVDCTRTPIPDPPSQDELCPTGTLRVHLGGRFLCISASIPAERAQ